jgi:hypothetical protein
MQGFSRYVDASGGQRSIKVVVTERASEQETKEWIAGQKWNC